MTSTRWMQIGGIAILLILIALAMTLFTFNRPLGPALDLDDPADSGAPGAPAAQAPPAATAPAARSAETAQPDRAASAAQDGAAAAAELSPVCGQSGRINLLMIGQNPADNFPNGADAVRLMVVDYDRPAVRMLALPPKLWVETTKLEGVEAATLTKAFGLAAEASGLNDPDRAVYAINILAQALWDNFGYHTDNYLTFDQTAFKELVDAVGSINVYVSKPVDGAPDGYGVYAAGLQEMDGQRALDYVRLLKPAGSPSDEWARFERQNQVIKGIQSEILHPEHWQQIPNFIHEIYDLLVTDLSPRQLLNLNCMLEATGGNVHLYEVTPAMLTRSPDGELLPDEAAISELIAAFTGPD